MEFENQGKINEDTRGDVIQLLGKIAPHWVLQMDDIVDTVHRVSQKLANKTRYIIGQFTRRRHRDVLVTLYNNGPLLTSSYAGSNR